jgi:hypothetical protein
MNTRILMSAVLALLFTVGSAFAESSIQVANEYGKPVAQFKVGDSQCVLRDDVIRCTPVSR